MDNRNRIMNGFFDSVAYFAAFIELFFFMRPIVHAVR